MPFRFESGANVFDAAGVFGIEFTLRFEGPPIRGDPFFAGLLGFTGIAGAATGIAKILFFVFLVLLIVAAIMSAVRGRPPV